MNISLIVAKAHGGFALLLFLLAITSLAMALKAAAAGSHQSFEKMAHITGLLETIFAGLVTLSGLIALYTTAWPLNQIWIWVGLFMAIAYSILLKRATKPARLEGNTLQWAMMQSIQVILVISAYTLMRLKPF